MKKIKDLNENDVIAHFLKGELDYEFEGVKLREYLLKTDKLSIVENPNTSSKEENIVRKKILSYRGYPNSLLFEGFPTDVKWALFELTNDDLNNIMFINNELFWKEITNNSRLIIDSVVTNTNNPRHKKILEISEEIKNDNILPEIILIKDKDSIIVLEGHHRAAAYAIESKNKKITINAIVGESNNLKGWYYY